MGNRALYQISFVLRNDDFVPVQKHLGLPLYHNEQMVVFMGMQFRRTAAFRRPRSRSAAATT